MYKIKLVQENSKVGDIKGNLDLAKSYIAQAISEKIDLIIFSEMFFTRWLNLFLFKGSNKKT